MKEIAKILELPVLERIQLVEAIWDSIVEVPDAVPVTEELRQELDRRLDEYYQNPDAVRPWEAIKSELLSRE